MKALSLALLMLGALATSPAMAAPPGALTLYNFETGAEETIDPRALDEESALSFLPDLPQAKALFSHYLNENQGIAFLALIESYADILSVIKEVPAPKSP